MKNPSEQYNAQYKDNYKTRFKGKYYDWPLNKTIGRLHRPLWLNINSLVL